MDFPKNQIGELREPAGKTDPNMCSECNINPKSSSLTMCGDCFKAKYLTDEGIAKCTKCMIKDADVGFFLCGDCKGMHPKILKNKLTF